MVSTMGKPDGTKSGNFVLIDGATLKVKGKYAADETTYGYDYWYQPKFNTMISSEFGTPNNFFKGFNPAGE